MIDDLWCGALPRCLRFRRGQLPCGLSAKQGLPKFPDCPASGFNRGRLDTFRFLPPFKCRLPGPAGHGSLRRTPAESTARSHQERLRFGSVFFFQSNPWTCRQGKFNTTLGGSTPGQEVAGLARRFAGVSASISAEHQVAIWEVSYETNSELRLLFELTKGLSTAGATSAANQFCLGLRAKLGFRHVDGQHACQTRSRAVIAGKGEILSSSWQCRKL